MEESATLIAILRGPGVYSPLEHPDRAIARRNLVLHQIAKEHPPLLSANDAARLAVKPVVLNLEVGRRMQAPNPTSILALKELEQAIRPDLVVYGGLRVVTVDAKWIEAVKIMAERHLHSIEARRKHSEGAAASRGSSS